MKVVKVTSKGQVTIPSEMSASLGIGEGTYMEVSEEGKESDSANSLRHGR